MSDVRIYLGVVTEVFQDDNEIGYCKIRATIKDYLENIIAYPSGITDQPQIGDPVMLTSLDNAILGQSFMYQLLRVGDATQISIGENSVRVSNNGVTIACGQTTIDVDADGIQIHSEGKISVGSDKGIALTGKITLPKSVLGGFCVEKVCPVDGQPHCVRTI